MRLKRDKVNLLIIICVVILCTVVVVPSLARYKNRTLDTRGVWDGHSVASSYRSGSGTSSDPYIISNGSELAKLSSDLQDVSNNGFENVYFKLGADIILNDGLLHYNDETDTVSYEYENSIYTVTQYTGLVQVDEGEDNIYVNQFSVLENFKGNLDGDYHRIYGLYLSNSSTRKLALFTNLTGSVSNLYIENALVYGGLKTAILSTEMSSANIENVMVDGYAIGNDINTYNSVNNHIESINWDINEENLGGEYINDSTYRIDSSLNIPTNSHNLTCSLSGNYVGSNIDSIKINNTSISSGNFDVAINNSSLIEIVASGSLDGNVKLTNLVYSCGYNYGASSGITVEATNSTFNNVVNKAYIKGHDNAAGIACETYQNVTIKNTYNKGNIYANTQSGISSGLINYIHDSGTLTRVYNSGNLTGYDSNLGSLISYVDGNISIDKSFDYNPESSNKALAHLNSGSLTLSNFFIDNTIDITDSIHMEYNGTCVQIDGESFYSKSFLETNLEMLEYNIADSMAQNITTENMWQYLEYEFPILYLDDFKNMKITLYANTYAYDNFTEEIKSVTVNKRIVFSIETEETVQSKYYYISSVPLSYGDLYGVNWKEYQDVSQITGIGSYYIYIKVNDYRGNTYYINSDLLQLTDNIDISISMGDYEWDSYLNELNTIYISENQTLHINTTLDDTSSISYYLARETLSIVELNNINSWESYSSTVDINTNGKFVLYVRETVNNSNVYISSDKLVYDGYIVGDLLLGRNGSLRGKNITSKSSVKLSFSYSSDENPNFTNYSHKLVSSILLPLGTKITLKDIALNKNYEYIISTDSDLYGYNENGYASYPLTMFSELGTLGAHYYSESSYYSDSVLENFIVIVDFQNTSIDTTYNNVSLYMELICNEYVRPTINSSKKKFNIVNQDSGETNLLIDEINNSIELASGDNYTIGFTGQLINNNYSGSAIINTINENKNVYLGIRAYYSNGSIIPSDKLTNLIFRVNGIEYYFDNNNTLTINLGSASNINDIDSELIITSMETGNLLPVDDYEFKIFNYTSFGNINYVIDNESINYQSVPFRISSNVYYGDYTFKVKVDDQSYIIDKNGSRTFNFNIKQSGLNDPNIRVSLYKKHNLTSSVDQSYALVDLGDYIDDSLEEATSNVYYLVNGTPESDSNYTLNIASTAETFAYKLVFYLYDGNTKVSEVEKYIIIK